MSFLGRAAARWFLRCGTKAHDGSIFKNLLTRKEITDGNCNKTDSRANRCAGHPRGAMRLDPGRSSVSVARLRIEAARRRSRKRPPGKRHQGTADCEDAKAAVVKLKADLLRHEGPETGEMTMNSKPRRQKPSARQWKSFAIVRPHPQLKIRPNNATVDLQICRAALAMSNASTSRCSTRAKP